MRRGHVLPAEPSSEPGPTFERGHCPVCSSRWQKRAADAQPRFRFPGYSRGEARLASALRGHHGGGREARAWPSLSGPDQIRGSEDTPCTGQLPPRKLKRETQPCTAPPAWELQSSRGGGCLA